MRIAIIGTGGVGGYFGARLAQSGHEVVFVARGAHLAALCEDGLQLFSKDGDVHLPKVEATEDAAGVAPVDLVLVCVKTYQLESAMDLIERLSQNNSTILPLLNGISAPERLAARFRGDHQVLGGYCEIISSVERPGIIRHHGVPPVIHLGQIGGSEDDRRVRSIRDALDVEGIEVQLEDDIEAGLWSKYIMVSSWGSVGAISRAPIGAILSIPESRDLLRSVMEESRLLGLAKGVALPADIVERTMAYVAALPEQGTTSLQRDLGAGRPSELEDWTGAAVQLSDRLGHAAPLNRAIYAALLPLERLARGFEVRGFSRSTSQE